MSGASEDVQRKHCEETLGHVYSGGDNSKAPGCGTCVCCAKKILGKCAIAWITQYLETQRRSGCSGVRWMMGRNVKM